MIEEDIQRSFRNRKDSLSLAFSSSRYLHTSQSFHSKLLSMKSTSESREEKETKKKEIVKDMLDSLRSDLIKHVEETEWMYKTNENVSQTKRE